MAANFIKKYSGVLLVAATLVVGLLTYKSYGISWDEQSQRIIGQTTYNYLFHGNKTLLNFGDNSYGVAFELPLILLEKTLRLKDTRNIYLMRHLVTHLFFLFSAFVFFLLINYLYKNKLLAAIGFLMLVATPLIYGHSFFNTKDVPFMCMFIICFMLCAVAFNKKTYKHYILLGVCCGLLTDIRIMGVLLIGCISFFLVMDYIALWKNKHQKKNIFFLFLAFIASSLFTIYLAWPYLWLNPVSNFIIAFNRMAKFPWAENVIFNGQLIPAASVPWNYSMVWFLISNPVIYLALGIFGIGLFVFHLLKMYKRVLVDLIERNNLLYFMCLVISIASVIMLHSVLYDAWRQLYFIYPSFILLAIYGLNKLFNTRVKWIVIGIVVLDVGLTVYYMADNFPNEHIYFNEFLRSDEPNHLRKNWDLDYWGTSYKQGFEYILKNDKSDTISIGVAEFSGIYNFLILKRADRERIHLVGDKDSAQYIITTYREHPGDYPFPPSRVYYSIDVLNSSILTVFKVK